MECLLLALEVRVVFDSQHQPLSSWFSLIKIAWGMNDIATSKEKSSVN